MDTLGEAYFIAGEIIIELEQWMELREKKRTHIRYKKEDQIRLLKLRTWSLRHRIPISEILDMIVPGLRERILFKKKYGFDVPVRVLTGASAKGMLHYEIAKRYAGNEHVLAWREEERERQLKNEKLEKLEGIPLKPKLHSPMEDDETVEEYVERYTKQAMAARDLERTSERQNWRRRKNYRNNPW